jgi:S-DNA-T family DNA segregation ATPase FtsK/SpoIIIE
MCEHVILRLTVQDPRHRTRTDIEVVAASGDSVSTLLHSLPLPAIGQECFVGTVPLIPEAKLADSPLLPGVVLSIGGPGPDYHPVRGAAAGTLHVVGGPDAGFGVALCPGRHTIGRMASAALRLDDEQASRTHAFLDVTAEGRALVRDAGSTNGTWVNDQRSPVPTPMHVGSRVRIGANTLNWMPGSPRALSVRQSADARLEFDRRFAPAPEIIPREVPAPPPVPAPRSNMTAMVMGSVAGVGMGIVLFFSTHAYPMLAVSAISVSAPFAVQAVDGRQRKKSRRAITAQREETDRRVKNLVGQEDSTRRLLAPGHAAITAMATGARDDLWPRDIRSPNGLTLRVGAADQAPASVRLGGPPWDGFQMPVLRDAPVTLDLRETGVLGVIGDSTAARSLLHWLIIQIATLRSPDDLRLVLLTFGTDIDIRWARWLPHLDAFGPVSAPYSIGNTAASRAERIKELRQLIADRLADRGGATRQPPGPEVVVVLDGAVGMRDVPGIQDILRLGPETGVYVLCADSQSMSECRGVIEVRGHGVTLRRSHHSQPETIVPDGLSEALAEQLARALAPMRDRIAAADAQAAIPYPVRLLDLLGIGVPSASDILALWRDKRPGPQTRVVLGADAAGPVTVDLAGQGPHTMLGGATGAGKSILLQTLVTALLLANRPDELNLVLVDFKGGSAFLPFEHCQHVTALIRSTGETAADRFDKADADRVLASVRTEVARREAILSRYGGEIDRYWQARESQPSLPSLPRLVMIFDEFARALESSPDFLKELVNVAAKGRSIGMHLVLATQSLQGKLSPELKNNITLRISLRQNEAADSTEVLGAADAADIPGTLRGRGMILAMADENRRPRTFQSGYLGDPPPSGNASRLTVRTVEWTDLGEERPAFAAQVRGGATDQELVIAAIEKASRQTDSAPPFRPLLPPLPARVPLDQLAWLATVPPPDSGVLFGLADVPDEQAQPACYLDLAGTDRLMVAGGPQSGRTTFARTLISSLATRFRPDQAHLYIVEHQPAGLSDYADLPHCGGVFSPAEPDRIRRLVGWLAAEAQRRAATRFAPGGRDNPVIVVIVDGWEQFENRADPALADVSLGPMLREVMAIGSPLGLHIVPIGGQSLLTGRVPDLCSQRLLLSFPNEDTRRTHLRSGTTTPPPLPGRAVDAGTGRHVQVCQAAVTAKELIAATHDCGDLDPGRLPREFPPLPARIGAHDLALPEPRPAPGWIPLGLGGQEVATVGIDLFDAGPHLMFISGPPESGRTTAVATLAHLLAWNGTDVLAVAPPQSPLARLLADDDGVRVVTGASIDDAALRAAAEPFGSGRYVVLLDDADRITIQATKKGISESPTLLDEIIQPAQLGHRALIVAGSATSLLAGGRRSLTKVTSEILLSGTRLLLTPAKRAEARDLKMTLEPDQYFTYPAGRGYLASVGGAQTLIQLAVTD